MYRAALRLREQRERRGLTQDQLAEKSGVGVATIRRIEGGSRRTDPPLSLIAKLAGALGVHPRRLIEWAEADAEA